MRAYRGARQLTGSPAARGMRREDRTLRIVDAPERAECRRCQQSYRKGERVAKQGKWLVHLRCWRDPRKGMFG